MESKESGDSQSFEFLYGMANARLSEALWLQAGNTRYTHVWLESFPELSEPLVGFTLTADYEALIEEGSDRFDVILPVTSTRLDDKGLLVDARVVEGDGAFMIISTKKYSPEHRFVVSPQAVQEQQDKPTELDGVEQKLLTYTIVPFRIKPDEVAQESA